jgi:hypothetical protein
MGNPNVTIADPELVYVPPSQQSCQRPVAKPGEPLIPDEDAVAAPKVGSTSPAPIEQSGAKAPAKPSPSSNK